MTDTVADPEVVEPTSEDIEATPRVEFIAGLRELADLYEAEPELPRPYGAVLNIFLSTKEELIAANGKLTGKREKSTTEAFFSIDRLFGGIGGVALSLNAARDAVCTKRKVGTTTVEVKDIENAPKKTITQDVYEYDCPDVMLPKAAA